MAGLNLARGIGCGQWRGKSFIQGGRAAIRQAIYRPALAAIRGNADLEAKYLALRAAESRRKWR
jgi:transposase